MISIPSGGLPCKKIFLIKWKPEHDEAKLRKSIADFMSNAIKYVIAHDFTSVAFPAIGCGDHQCSTDLVIKTMAKEMIYQIQSQKESLLIKIIVQAERQDIYEAFCKEIPAVKPGKVNILLFRFQIFYYLSEKNFKKLHNEIFFRIDLTKSSDVHII